MAQMIQPLSGLPLVQISPTSCHCHTIGLRGHTKKHFCIHLAKRKMVVQNSGLDYVPMNFMRTMKTAQGGLTHQHPKLIIFLGGTYHFSMQMVPFSRFSLNLFSPNFFPENSHAACPLHKHVVALAALVDDHAGEWKGSLTCLDDGQPILNVELEAIWLEVKLAHC